MLVVLDNARDADHVRPLLPGGSGCLVLVTSRNQLTSLAAAEGAHHLALDLLTTEESRDLLTRRLGVARVAAEPEAIIKIITTCARLPLALSIVAAHADLAKELSPAVLAEELRASRDRLTALSTGDDPHTDVRAVFSWSYDALTPDAARLFRLLGLHPGPDITAAATASLARSGDPTHLGDTYHATNDLDAAREAWQQALTILDQLDHPDAGQIRAKLANLQVRPQ
jgi:NB-ARC domain